MLTLRETLRQWTPSWLPQVLAYTFSAACLLWVLYNYNIRDFTAAVRTLDWKWVALAVALDVSVY
ncbi:MAG: hypothetical protein KGM92_21450, partial [Acidobacteriota bacterium]|nr:hypothetical protein [Acidobacteriota bacterium]